MPHDFRIGVDVIRMEFVPFHVGSQVSPDVEHFYTAPMNTTFNFYVVTASTFFFWLFWLLQFFWVFLIFFVHFFLFFQALSSLRSRWWGGMSFNTSESSSARFSTVTVVATGGNSFW